MQIAIKTWPESSLYWENEVITTGGKIKKKLAKNDVSELYDHDNRGLGGLVGLTLPMARTDRGSRPVCYLPCSDLGQVVNLSLSVA